MRIIERRISAREDGGGHIVEFVYEDGKLFSLVRILSALAKTSLFGRQSACLTK